jgi:sulfonate transport system permease protein
VITVRRLLAGLVMPAAIILAYALWTQSVRNPYFPTISRILERFQEMWLFELFISDVVPSLSNLLIGWSAASAFGIGAGLLLGRIRVLRLLFSPLLDFGRSVPAIMLIPPLVLVLGVGDSSKIAIITLGAFFPIALSTMDGLRQVDPGLIDVTRALQISRLRELQVAWLPSAAPSISGGMQTGLQFAFILMVASEMLAATHGLGYRTMQAQLSFDSASVWAGIVLLAILGFLLNAVFIGIRNRALAWYIAMQSTSRTR